MYTPSKQVKQHSTLSMTALRPSHTPQTIAKHIHAYQQLQKQGLLVVTTTADLLLSTGRQAANNNNKGN